MIDELAGTAGDGAADASGAGEVRRCGTVGVAVLRRVRPGTPLAAPADAGPGRRQWTVFAPDGHPLAAPLRAALAESGVGAGVLLCLPDSGAGPRVAVPGRGPGGVAGRRHPVRRRAAPAGRGGPGAGRCTWRTPSVATTVVGLADPAPTATDAVDEIVRHVVGDVAGTDGFAEVRYEADGTRTAPVLRPLPAPDGPAGAPRSARTTCCWSPVAARASPPSARW